MMRKKEHVVNIQMMENTLLICLPIHGVVSDLYFKVILQMVQEYILYAQLHAQALGTATVV